MTFEKLLGPLHLCGREMEPVNVFQPALAQPLAQPEAADAAQETGRRSARHGLPGANPAAFPRINPATKKKRLFPARGTADVVQKHDDEDEHKSVMRDVG